MSKIFDLLMKLMSATNMEDTATAAAVSNYNASHNTSHNRKRKTTSSSSSSNTTSPLTRLLCCLLLIGAAKVANDVRATLRALGHHTAQHEAVAGMEPGSLPLAARNLGDSNSAVALQWNNQQGDPTYRASHGLDIMQVVRTRFMQRQPKLVALGQSRLELFKTFCLPTMLKQTLQDFAWLVYTDPDLDKDLLQQLTDLLKPHPNFYLILSNDNKITVPQLVEDAATNPSMVLTGNLDYLTRSIHAHAASQASVILYIETGLDADDGLQQDTLSEIQKHAVAETYLWNSPTQRDDSYHWFILCVGNHYEWKNVDVMLGKTKDFRGIIGEHHNKWRCVTPGLTMVNSLTAPHDPAAPRRSIFSLAPFPYNEIVVNHWRLNEKYPNCRKHGANEFEPCWKQINNNDKTHTAIRARTITSTGMKDVITNPEEQLKSDALWETMKSDFGIQVSQVKKASKIMYTSRIKTLKELMQGRCKRGHSCLDQTEKDLKDLLTLLQRR